MPYTVRLLDDGAVVDAPLLKTKPPFTIEGASNVFLETVKRGLDDDFSKDTDAAPTVVLRLYEAYGGHAQVRLRLAPHLHVIKAVVTNLLEDELTDLAVVSEENSAVLNLKFHGFEVKTVKLMLGQPGCVPYVHMRPSSG